MRNNKFKKLNKGVIVLLFVLIFLQAGSAIAATLDDYYKQRDYYAAQAAEAKKKAEQKKKEAEQVKQQLAVVAEDISQTQAALKSTMTELEKTQATIEELKVNIATEEENLAKEKTRMGNVLSSWYMEGEEGLFESVLSSNNLSEIITKQQYYEAIRQQIDDSIEKINKLKEELKAKKEEQDKHLRDLEDLENSQKEQKSYLESQEAYKEKLLNNATTAIAQLNQKEKDALAREQQVEAQIISMISARAGSWGAQRGKGQRVSPGNLIGTMGSTGFSTGAHLHFEVRTAQNVAVDPRNYIGSKFVWPTLSHRVTQEFGKTSFSSNYSSGLHSGMDIGAQTPGVQGDPIFAAGSGEIVLKQWYGGYGYAVVILHDDNMITLYGHLATAG